MTLARPPPVSPMIEAIQKLQLNKVGALAHCRALAKDPARLTFQGLGPWDHLNYAARQHLKSSELLEWFPELVQACQTAGLDLNEEARSSAREQPALITALLSMTTPDCGLAADALWNLGARARQPTQTIAMHAACVLDSDLPLRWMLTHGFDPNKARSVVDGRGPLHIVATSPRQFKTHLAALLLEFGCNPRVPNDAGWRAYDWALLRRSHAPTAEVGQLLFAAAERLDLQDAATFAPRAPAAPAFRI